MTRYRDPNAPAGRVVFGGEAFIDGVTADIEIGPETVLLFESAGITETDTPDPESGAEPIPDEKPATKPASRRSK